MQKTSERELDPRDARLLKKTEELRIHLLGNDGVRERVSLRAYELYEKRGADHGLDLEDWVQAGNEVLSPLIEQKLKLSRETSKETARNMMPAKPLSRKPK
ncbi:MAG: DUF2934 domain-containing protein [Acidobacteria bacterium]|nr:DUF2934 domain-containing protein [Acidobacteriota bacterium]